MRINIYYGGRGLIEDPTIYVMNKITEVLQEIRVEVKRYNLYEEKNNLSVLPNTIKEAEGIILATTVEWIGIGGFMQQFLDACWLYGDKEKISKTYMMPVVIANTYGERDAEVMLTKAWELLGGIPVYGLCAYIEERKQFETNKEYAALIERKAESLYRMINQNTPTFPCSNMEIKQSILKNTMIELTPQESEQLSKYVSDDNYVKKQKEDIEELAQIFKEMLGDGNAPSDNQEFIKNLQNNFHPSEDFKASYGIEIIDEKKILIIEINRANLKCYYGEKANTDVTAKTTHDVMDKIVHGRTTFQRAFMSGELTAKGDFKTLRAFDTIFQFNML